MGKLLGSGVLIVWVDLDPAVESLADRWYVTEHLPERISEAGYLRARRYRALAGGPAYMSVFEAATPDALASDGYRRITATISPLSQRIRAGFRRCIRSTHHRIASAGGASGGIILCVRLDFADSTQRSAFVQWAERSLATWVAAHGAILAAHALAPARDVRERMDSFRASGQQDEWADGVLLIELSRPQDAEGDLLRALSPEALAAAGMHARTITTAVYQLMVEFSTA